MILSVDGGATKTCALLFDETSKRLLSVGLAGPSNFTAVPESVASENIKSTVMQVEEKSGISINDQTRIIIGLAGIGDSTGATERGKNMLGGIFHRSNLRIENDGFVAYRMSNMFSDGVVFAPGTGSVGMFQKDGKITRIGGWGWFAGDEGSASWIGREAIRTAERQMDGILEGNDFVNLVSGHFGEDFREVVGSLERDHNKRKVALLSPKVVEMARSGEKYATEIIKSAANYDALIVNSMLKSFKDCPEVSVLGGTMIAGSIIRDRISSSVRCKIRFFNGYHVAIGGIVLALSEQGNPVNTALRDSIIEDLDERIRNFDHEIRINSLGY